MIDRNFLRCAASALLLGLANASPNAIADGVGAPLQERMSYAQFRKLGLDQLSAGQLKGLNAWLEAQGDCGKALAAASAPTGTTPVDRHEPSTGTVESRIAGDFTGWSDDTVLVLQNGQHWRVTDDEPMHIATMHAPKVTVRRGLFNTWLLGVAGIDETAHVVPAN
ncbi:MAG: hypothetical protein WBV39_00985 [Rudaea sp.]